MRKLLLFLLVLLLAAAAAVALFPAKVALDLALKGRDNIRAEQVSGTVWRGHIGALQVGDNRVGAVGWKLHPMPLLSGTVVTDLRVQGEELDLEARAQRGRDGVLRITDLIATLPAHVLTPVVDSPALELRGSLRLNLVEVELVQLWPRLIRGEALWQDAAVTGEAEARLGDLAAEFATQADGRLVGLLSDRGGPLSLEGEFIIGLRGYEVSAVLSGDPNNRNLMKALEHVGEDAGDGSRLLLIEGGPRR
jgi:general secretion pathway protein N